MPSSWMQELSNHARTVYRLCFGQPGPCYITRLPADILIDLIFPQLLIEELLRLRKVSKPFYLLTHEPVIWRRYLRKLHGIPIAQLRPTFEFLGPIGAYEIEHFVTTACALDRAWRFGAPAVQRRHLVTGMHKVIDLKLVPGGKFLVASVKDRANQRFFLMVYALQLADSGARLLARLPTYHKAYDLQAKYLKHQGRPGIMISYTCRKFMYGTPQNVNLADFSHRYAPDTIHPLSYEACVVHFPLDIVEPLLRPLYKPLEQPLPYTNVLKQMDAPFRDVARTVPFDKEIHVPSLFEVRGEPFLGLVEGTDTLYLLNLMRNLTSIMTFPERIPGMPHRIRGFRYLPCQRGLLVVRTASTAPDANDTIFFEFHKFPTMTGLTASTCDHPWICEDVWKLEGDFQISDSDTLTKKLAPHHPNPKRREECPPTLWVFAPSWKEQGTAYWHFRPQRVGEAEVDDPPRPWVFHYPANEYDMALRSYFHRNTQHHEFVLPGSERSLFVEIDKGINDAPVMHGLRRFMFPSSRFPRVYETPGLYETTGLGEPVTALIEKDSWRVTFRDIGPGKFNSPGEDMTKEGGLSAITWDENTGKICMASENEDVILVVDLAPLLSPQEKYAYKWNVRLLDPDLVKK